MKTFRRMLPYLCLDLAAFYLLPLFIQNTGSAIVILLAAIPLICFLCSVFYGIKNGFHWQYAVAVAVSFIPSVFLFYNSSAWIYTLGYGISALIGNLSGRALRKII